VAHRATASEIFAGNGETKRVMSATELAKLGTEIVNGAEGQSMTLRMTGGVAIYARCPSIETHATLQRAHSDLDFVAATKDWGRVAEFFALRGWRKKSDAPTKMEFEQTDVIVEVNSPTHLRDFALDFSARLAVTPLTLPLADLLLQKLARVNFQEKDIQDCAALLVDHRVVMGGDEEEDINREYFYRVVNQEYKLWKTVFNNTVTLEKVFDKYLEPEEAQLAWRRTELLQEVLDGKQHSASWWVGRVVTR
jgi:hypothetical protein